MDTQKSLISIFLIILLRVYYQPHLSAYVYSYQPKFEFSTFNLKLTWGFFHRNLFFSLYF